MTNVEVIKNNNKIKTIRVLGHSDFAHYGKDVCCAAISAITFFTINGVESFSKDKNIINVDISRDKAKIEINVNDVACENTQKFLVLLVKHFKELKRQFPKNLKIKED